MKENSIAKRYASGLVKTVANSDEYSRVKNELEEFNRLLHSIHNFKAGMETFLLSHKQKKEMLESIQQKIDFSPKTFRFLLTVIEENRMVLLDQIIIILEELWFEKNGIEKMKVFSAVPLNKRLEDKLTHKLETIFNKKIVLETDTDPSLLAGIKIQRGLVFYDLSLEGNLRKLKHSIIGEL